MKQTRAGDPAPALTRGLRVLALLALDGQSSLEQLARKTAWPKSSVLRYLLALEAVGVVAQDASSKAWTARQVLAPAPADAFGPDSAARRKLPFLAASTGHCAELYRVADDQVALIDRAEPENAPVSVNARIGFRRCLQELDATAAITFAFSDVKPPRRLWRWRHGKRAPVAAKEAAATIADVRRRLLAQDGDFNIHGIRRFAVPVFSGPRLAGVLAIAQRQTPRATFETALIERTLASVSSQLSA